MWAVFFSNEIWRIYQLKMKDDWSLLLASYRLSLTMNQISNMKSRVFRFRRNVDRKWNQRTKRMIVRMESIANVTTANRTNKQQQTDIVSFALANTLSLYLQWKHVVYTFTFLCVCIHTNGSRCTQYVWSSIGVRLFGFHTLFSWNAVRIHVDWSLYHLFQFWISKHFKCSAALSS